jgi:hypothetical protein
VTGNTFNLTMSHVGASCTTSNSCGPNAVFSNWGTYPSWSPYQGTVVENAIANSQNNHFSGNTYHGPWRFLNRDTSAELSFSTWQAAPNNQDAGSTMG